MDVGEEDVFVDWEMGFVNYWIDYDVWRCLGVGDLGDVEDVVGYFVGDGDEILGFNVGVGDEVVFIGFYFGDGNVGGVFDVLIGVVGEEEVCGGGVENEGLGDEVFYWCGVEGKGLVRIGVDLDVWDSCSKKMVCRWIMFCCVVWLLVLD